MALNREQKAEILDEIEVLLANSKLTVMAAYSGTSVKAMQELRSMAKNDGTVVRVIKNRLFKKALSKDSRFAAIDQQLISGQLIYAFNPDDEIAPAQALSNFAKNEPQITFVGAISSDGTMLSPSDVQVLASLPSKDQLRAQLIGTISAPMSGFVNVLSGNVRSVLNVLNARAEQM